MFQGVGVSIFMDSFHFGITEYQFQQGSPFQVVGLGSVYKTKQEGVTVYEPGTVFVRA